MIKFVDVGGKIGVRGFDSCWFAKPRAGHVIYCFNDPCLHRLQIFIAALNYFVPSLNTRALHPSHRNPTVLLIFAFHRPSTTVILQCCCTPNFTSARLLFWRRCLLDWQLFPGCLFCEYVTLRVSSISFCSGTSVIGSHFSACIGVPHGGEIFQSCVRKQRHASPPPLTSWLKT